MRPGEAKPVRAGTGHCFAAVFQWEAGKPMSPVPAQLWFGAGGKGTGPVLISLAQFLCLVEQGAVVDGQKKPQVRLEAGNGLEAFPGGKAGAPCEARGGTLAFLVSQGHSQIHGGVARIRLRRQIGATSCKRAAEIRARRPLGPDRGKGTPKKCPSWRGSPPRDTPRLHRFYPRADSRPKTKCGFSPLPKRASTHLAWFPRTA